MDKTPRPKWSAQLHPNDIWGAQLRTPSTDIQVRAGLQTPQTHPNTNQHTNQHINQHTNQHTTEPTTSWNNHPSGGMGPNAASRTLLEGKSTSNLSGKFNQEWEILLLCKKFRLETLPAETIFAGLRHQVGLEGLNSLNDLHEIKKCAVEVDTSTWQSLEEARSTNAEHAQSITQKCSTAGRLYPPQNFTFCKEEASVGFTKEEAHQVKNMLDLQELNNSLTLPNGVLTKKQDTSLRAVTVSKLDSSVHINVINTENKKDTQLIWAASTNHFASVKGSNGALVLNEMLNLCYNDSDVQGFITSVNPPYRLNNNPPLIITYHRQRTSRSIPPTQRCLPSHQLSQPRLTLCNKLQTLKLRALPKQQPLKPLNPLPNKHQFEVVGVGAEGVELHEVEADAVEQEVVEPLPLEKVLDLLTVRGPTIKTVMGFQPLTSFGVSKREVAEIINEYVIANGGESRVWRGIDQQITSLETKFRVALAYRDQTGQGILDEAEERARQAGGDPEDSDTKDFVGDAITQTEAQIRKRCKYFYELEPVMLDRPSATPLDTTNKALNLGNEDRPTTPDHWSESERGGNASPVNTLGQPSPDLTQTLPSVSQPSRAQGSTTTTPLGSAPGQLRRANHRPTLPSREDMAAQSAAEIQLNRERLDADTRMVDANIELANAIRQGLAPTVSPPETTTLQRRQLELNVQLREVEIARARAALEAERATGAAFARAKMIQDFMRAGLSPDDALRFTNDTLASAPPTR
ncbi:hypothetical protein H4Q26_013336 [Puccinia striiformis f. sp. tritici PST-130]|nr:hypothetical protein H4Q26_013336 [Puccinia striiformis f. sp. tritici PST-130]